MKTLRLNIRLLGDMLGEIIVQQAGESVFELEETIRGLSKGWRDGDESARQKVGEIINALANDLRLTSDIIKAFSTYFQLVNLAEEHERIRVLNRRASQAFEDNQPMDESILSAVETLKREGFTAEQVFDMLARMLIMPVFTAHPTESKRRTIRQILAHISASLNELDTCFPFQEEQIREELAEYVTLLWQSDESRSRRPTVMDEVRNTGAYFFENTLLDLVPRIYDELEQALSQAYPGRDWRAPTILRFGSWIGGDRDGNPFVTNQTTESALRGQKEMVLERYATDIQALYEMLSPSRGRATFDTEFLEELKSEIEQLPQAELDSVRRFEEEPYRQKLILMYRRILATIEQNKQPWKVESDDRRAYASAAEFLDALKLIESSLRNNKGAILTCGRLSHLIRRVEVFGFHLASLDVRQHAGQHEEALAEIFARYHVCEPYETLSEAQRIEVLTRETENRRPLTAELQFSESTNETISLFRLIAMAHQKTGESSVQTWIISMAESVSDVLEVLLLMSDANLFGKMDIVPLFETVKDLKAAPLVMSRLFENPVYRQHLAARGNGQQIMIGYSDSNKDGGFLHANWMLFTAQRELAKTCQEYDINLTLFHGRGGSIGRGGGPANRAILAQPPESIRGRIRITEQGEVVSSRYTHVEIAKRHLQQLIHAVMCSGGRRPEFEKLEEWSEIVDQLSQSAYCKYRALVEKPGFIEYFHAATPIDQIDQLNLGSRPARRKKTQTINDLRAIPWVFAWTQSRTNIPSWYGVGTAIDEWISCGDENLILLQQMYEQWPFFKTTFDNVHLGMGRADMDIARLYSKLAVGDVSAMVGKTSTEYDHREFGDTSPSPGEEIFTDIRDEFELSKSLVLRVTGHANLLDSESWLQHSIHVRNPYVDPMNYIQVALLKRFRISEDAREREQIQTAILQSVNGIASGLQNVG